MECVKHHVDPTYLIGSNPIRLLYVSEPMRVWPVVGAHEFLVAVAPKEYDAMSVIDIGRSLQKVRSHDEPCMHGNQCHQSHHRSRIPERRCQP